MNDKNDKTTHRILSSIQEEGRLYRNEGNMKGELHNWSTAERERRRIKQGEIGTGAKSTEVLQSWEGT